MGFNLLDDDILDAALHAKTFPSNDTLGTHSDNGFIGTDLLICK